VGKKIKILVAKPGLDGHDRGAKVVALALKNAGMDVIYSGLHQSIDAIVSTAIQEDVDCIGLSIMTGGHLQICRNLQEKLKDKGAGDKMVSVGGVIPKRDIAELEAMGIRGIFPGGTPLQQTIKFIQENA
jgi:methylmalonyl-CoA mutase C-terminal domain/subunit